MTYHKDMPISLDQRGPQRTSFDTPEQRRFEPPAADEMSAHAQGEKELQLQKDASRLKELLSMETSTLPSTGAKEMPDSEAPALPSTGPKELLGMGAPALPSTGPKELLSKEAPALPSTGAKEMPNMEAPALATPSPKEVPRKEGATVPHPLTAGEDGLPNEQKPLPSGPFALFQSAMPATLQAAPTLAANPINDLDVEITHIVRTLLVGENAVGNHMVRMELSSERLPGVTLEVYRDAGALVAQFVCANEHSRLRLTQAASWLSESLSVRLKNDTVVRLLTDDPDAPNPMETRHSAT